MRGCPNPADFGQLTGASPCALLCLRTEICLCVRHTILPELPHCRDLRLPRKQACHHSRPQAKPTTQCGGLGHMAQGGLKSCTPFSPQNSVPSSVLPSHPRLPLRHRVESVLLPAELAGSLGHGHANSKHCRELPSGTRALPPPNLQV